MTVPTSTAPSTRDTTVAVGDLDAVGRALLRCWIVVDGRLVW
jgi:hypothetical protein